jgi:hypothetical protein
VARAPRDPIDRLQLTLPPDGLRDLTDALVADPAHVRRMLESRQPSAPEEIYRWIDILEHARDLVRADAPGPLELLRAAGELATGVVGIGLSFAGPVIGDVPAMIGLAVGLGGSALTLWDGGLLLHRALRAEERERAILLAQEGLRSYVAGL